MEPQLNDKLSKKMDKSHILVKVNLERQNKMADLILKRFLFQRKLTNELKKFEEFVKSEEWKKIHDDPNGHSVAYSYMKTLFKGVRCLIYDNGVVTFDDFNLISNISNKQKEYIDNIDKNKKAGIYKIRNLYIVYMGSTAVFSSSSAGKNIKDGWETMIDEVNQSWEFFIDGEKKNAGSWTNDGVIHDSFEYQEEQNQKFLDNWVIQFANEWNIFNSEYEQGYSNNGIYSQWDTFSNSFINGWKDMIGRCEGNWKTANDNWWKQN